MTAKREKCHWCNGTGVEPKQVVRCMCCSAPIRSLREAREPCPRGSKHMLSIGDAIYLGEKFKASELRAWIGKDWKDTVKRAKEGRS